MSNVECQDAKRRSAAWLELSHVKLRRLQYIDLLFSAKLHPVEPSKGLTLIFA